MFEVDEKANSKGLKPADFDRFRDPRLKPWGT
jgi:hypothetical protein